MTEEPKLAKATLQQIRWTAKGKIENKDAKGNPSKPIEVQFNPQTLKVNYSNQKAGGDQVAGSPIQFVGKGITKLTLELLFDTTVKEVDGPGKTPDVRVETEKIFTLMVPVAGTGKHKKEFIPPGVCFQWGSFLFNGVVDSMDENLDFFSSTGVPLRATVSLSLSRQDLSFERMQADAEGAGTSAFQEAKAGESVQKMAARAGNPDWKGVALANGIENPRLLAPGALVNLSATGVSASLGGSLSVGGVGLGDASFGISAGASFGGGGSLAGSASLGASLSLGGSASFDASASFGSSASLGGAASLGGGLSAGFGAGAGLSLDAGAGASLGAGASASASLNADFGADGFSADASASADASVR